jgi:uncharacterized protein (DUF983 family)
MTRLCRLEARGVTVPREKHHLFRSAIARGWARRCPHCGQGPLYTGWVSLRESCPSCGLVYERNAGDTWLFINVGDRVFILLLIAIIYFGVPGTYPRLAMVLFVLVAIALVWTTPNRWGVGTALHYLSRAYGEDADDPIPDRTHDEVPGAGHRRTK